MADILHRIRISAPPKKVFDLIATAEGIAHWWSDDSSAATEVDGVSVFNFLNGTIVFRMKINAYDPGRQLGWTFLGDYDDWNGTTIRWDFVPTDDGGTELSLAHRGWPTTENEYRVCNTSWGHLLHLMKDHAEGKAVALPESGRNGSSN